MPATEILNRDRQINDHLIRDHLVQRRQRLAAVVDPPRHPDLTRLLLSVDSALERLAQGDWGACAVCHEPVESDRLLADPLVSVCLGCLTPEQRRALEHDLETAARIQAALLPPPRVERSGWEIARVYEPLGTVSGDYVDVVEPADGEGTLIAFGDVAGKGVAAAMVMSQLHALLRSLIRLELPLPELMERTNALLLASTTASSYATLVVARLGDDGALEIANGGHLPPLVVHAEGVRPLPITGVPVGLLPEVRFQTLETRMEPGETLLLFTDGLSEAPDAAGSEFGPRRVGATAARHHGAAAPAMLATLRNDLDAFLSGSPRVDDLSLMAVRRR
ncbi:MAG: serine/threonine-protein phosphatase [Acidobacteriota bacterium]|nr:serine/threonine-protein phosphatase [Acidobacteriota bacterium]MDH3523976.1 serine/threonine-protein phosphatase [Acidobacteriota bacterium]